MKRALVEDASTDTVGLWAVLWQMKHELPEASQLEVREAVLSAIREALIEGTVVAGRFASEDPGLLFEPWTEANDAIVARIDEEWEKLGSDPHAGDVCWFLAPSRMPVSAKAHPMSDSWRPVAPR